MQLKTQKFTRSVADVRLQFSIKSPVFLNCDGKTKGSELSRAVSGQTLAQHGYRTGTAVEKKRVCVCVADRAGEPAGSAGSSSVGIPQPLCRNPPTALQQDGGQVLIRPPVIKVWNKWMWVDKTFLTVSGLCPG